MSLLQTNECNLKSTIKSRFEFPGCHETRPVTCRRQQTGGAFRPYHHHHLSPLHQAYTHVYRFTSPYRRSFNLHRINKMTSEVCARLRARCNYPPNPDIANTPTFRRETGFTPSTHCRVLNRSLHNSKTFLARLCEQAERYDGENKIALNALSLIHI